MTPAESVAEPVASMEEIQEGWHELTMRVGTLESERAALELENKNLRFLLERAIEHRQKSHGELILLLTGLLGKLPINDVGVMVSRLVEHNANVSEVCAALTKGAIGAELPKPAVLKALEQTKRDLAAALKPAVEALSELDPPLETAMLRSLEDQPELFFSPPVVRANRCFAKGQVPRERIVREFGEDALVFFNDMTTDPKLNPRPKAEEIVLAFKPEFEELFNQNPGLLPGKRDQLLALHQKILRSKGNTPQARAQKSAFQRLSFIVDLLHYYENQSTEAVDVIFAQRLPALIEQLALTGPQDPLDEKSIAQAEVLLGYLISSDHRLMVLNNVGKSGGSGRTLKFVLKLRWEHLPDRIETIADFVRHLLPPSPQKPPPAAEIAAVLRLISPAVLWQVVKALSASDRIRRAEAEALGRAVAKELGLTGLDEEMKAPPPIPMEMETQMAWEKVKELINQRGDPAAIAAAIRDRLHAKYDGDELKQSWLTLIEADAMPLIRTICQLPYLPDGSTDSIAHTVLDTYVTRLTHEKYAATYAKIANSLKNMYRAKPDSPTLLNFLALVRWVDPSAASRMSADIGMPAQG